MGALLCPDNQIAKSLVVATTMLSGLSALMTLILAIIVFDRFGLGQKSQDKSFETVLKLYNALSNLCFSIEYFVNEDPENSLECSESKGVLFVRSYFPDATLRDIDGEYLKSPMVVTYSCIEALEGITTYTNDLFLPFSVKQHLDKFLVHCFTEFKGTSIYTVLSTTKRNIDRKYDFQKLFVLNHNQLTTEQFLDDYKGLKLSIRNWLISHGANDKDINIIN